MKKSAVFFGFMVCVFLIMSIQCYAVEECDIDAGQICYNFCPLGECKPSHITVYIPSTMGSVAASNLKTADNGDDCFYVGEQLEYCFCDYMCPPSEARISVPIADEQL